MIPLPRIAATLGGALALAACGASGDTAEGGAAENSRILEGSVSDEMIPYEKLRSEPPAARVSEGESKGGGSGGGGAGAGAPQASSGDAEDAAQEATAEPAQSPATEDPED